MKVWLVASLAGVGLLATGLAAVRAEEKEAAPAVAEFAWLAGTWRSDHDGHVFEEHWLPPAGGTMAAVSRSVEGEKTGMVELSTIEAGEGGKPVLRIRHFGAGLVPWKTEAGATPSWPLLSSKKGEAVFEDPARTFPRRIVYRLEDAATLVARLEPAEGSKQGPMEFRLKKAR